MCVSPTVTQAAINNQALSRSQRFMASLVQGGSGVMSTLASMKPTTATKPKTATFGMSK